MAKHSRFGEILKTAEDRVTELETRPRRRLNDYPCWIQESMFARRNR